VEDDRVVGQFLIPRFAIVWVKFASRVIFIKAIRVARSFFIETLFAAFLVFEAE
jgi:hypothetical protein